MTFEQTRQILEARMFDTSANTRLHPYSTTSTTGDNRLASMTAKKELVAVQSNSSGVYTEAVKVQVFRDGQTFEQPNNKPFIIMFINDSGNRTAAFGKGLTKASGVVRFRISVPRDSSNPVRTARLIADAIDLRVGFEAGSSIADIGRFPNGKVGGTLFTQSGSFNKVSGNENSYMIYTLDFIYDYYN